MGRKWTKARLAQLDEQIIDVLTVDYPQSIRHVFYRMTDTTLAESVDKDESGYRRVQNRCKLLRESGAIPYAYITDTTRLGWHTPTYTGGKDFLRKVAGMYRQDVWGQHRHICEVWVESRSIAGVLRDTCEELAVSLYPCAGFPSLSLAHEAAGNMAQHIMQGFDVTVYYIGDYDPSGVEISADVQNKLYDFLYQHDTRMGEFLHFERLAVNEELIAELDLPTKPRKKTDMRQRHITETVEAEAIPAQYLRELVATSVSCILPANAFQSARVAEESERAHILEMAQ